MYARQNLGTSTGLKSVTFTGRSRAANHNQLSPIISIGKASLTGSVHEEYMSSRLTNPESTSQTLVSSIKLWYKLKQTFLRHLNISETSTDILVIFPLVLCFEDTRNHSIYRVHFGLGKMTA